MACAPDPPCLLAAGPPVCVCVLLVGSCVVASPSFSHPRREARVSRGSAPSAATRRCQCIPIPTHHTPPRVLSFPPERNGPRAPPAVVVTWRNAHGDRDITMLYYQCHPTMTLIMILQALEMIKGLGGVANRCVWDVCVESM